MQRVVKFLISTVTFLLTVIVLVTQKIFNKKNLPIIIFVVIILVVLSGIVYGIYNLINKNTSSETKQIQIAPARATTKIGSEFIFPLKNSSGNEVGKLKYMIESAELRNEIVVKGQKAKSVKGRIFFIINLKITNDFKQKIEMQTADYIRLSINGNKDIWLAPDIHSDPVAVQAISTKYIKVGFAINESDKDLVLRVGEINGEKTEVPIKF